MGVCVEGGCGQTTIAIMLVSLPGAGTTVRTRWGPNSSEERVIASGNLLEIPGADN